METFSFNPPINLAEESKWLLAITSFETTNSVFNIIDENNFFSKTLPSYWNIKSAEKFIDELNKLLDLRSQNDIDLHVEQVRKKGIIFINDYSFSSLGTFRNEVPEELKDSNYNDLEDMLYRSQLSYDEIINILYLKYSPTTTIGYTLPPGLHESSVIN